MLTVEMEVTTKLQCTCYFIAHRLSTQKVERPLKKITTFSLKKISMHVEAHVENVQRSLLSLLVKTGKRGL